MKHVKRFEREDWYGWAGAEQFPDGSEPVIFNGVVDYRGKVEPVTVVGDRNGVEVHVGEDPVEPLEVVGRRGFFTAEEIDDVVGLLKLHPRVNFLRKLGFVEL